MSFQPHVGLLEDTLLSSCTPSHFNQYINIIMISFISNMSDKYGSYTCSRKIFMFTKVK